MDRDVPIERLFALLDPGDKTSQRFTWLIGDVCEIDPNRVAIYLPLLFSLRNEMPFPGMQRSVSKWLLLTSVPAEVETAAIKQLLSWVRDPQACIASKSYSARALFELVKTKRLSRKRAMNALVTQLDHVNRSYAYRITRLAERLNEL